MSQRRVAARVERVEARHRAVVAELDLRRVANNLGVSVAELRAELAEINTLCAAAGAVTVDDQIAALAEHAGLPVADLRAEVTAMREAGW
jgi:hypothetical protein